MALGDVLSGIGGILGTAYNLYTNKRDFDYQKALQQKMFEREDTAVQRRVEDLKAAGMNPFLATGSSAGAGSVVSRSNTNDINTGAALDMIQAVNNIRHQKQETENAKVEHEILENQKAQLEFTKDFNFYTTMSQLGFDITPEIFTDRKGNKGLDLRINYDLGEPLQTVLMKDGNQRYYYPGNQKYRNMILNTFNYNYDMLKNSADLLQRDVDWYVADKISGMALPFLKLFK